ncbi:MAG: hypothetical protein LBG18_04595, partial [Mediterranea sp.]|nr:hypothetical protein [Mediterranea sp.]
LIYRCKYTDKTRNKQRIWAKLSSSFKQKNCLKKSFETASTDVKSMLQKLRSVFPLRENATTKFRTGISADSRRFLILICGNLRESAFQNFTKKFPSGCWAACYTVW